MSPLLVVALLFSIATDYVPYEEVQSVAQLWAKNEWPAMTLAKVLTYYNFDGEVSSYAFIFSEGVFPPEEILIDNIKKMGGRRDRYGVDKFGTIIMGARFNQIPMLQLYRGLPPWYSIRRYLPEELKDKRPICAYYYAPLAEWIEFETADGKVLVDGYSARMDKKEEFVNGISFLECDEDLSHLTKKKWLDLMNHRFTRQDSNYVPGSVPFYEWHYGCSPTASSMVLGYWNNRNYDRLVDFFFGPHYSIPENSWDDGVVNVNRELALAMGTDTTTGGTSVGSIRFGTQAVCNGWGNNYSFTCSQWGPGGPSNPQVTWNPLRQQVDAGRPVHWCVLNYHHPSQGFINHSMTGIGYKVRGGESLVCVNTTWYANEEWLPIYTWVPPYASQDWVISAVPGGGINAYLDLTWPRAAVTLFRNLKYKLKWSYTGSIDHLDIYYHTGYNSNYWTTIATGVAPGFGEYVWTVPDDTIEGRIALRGYDASSTVITADGESLGFITRTYEHSAELVLVGHYDTDGTARDVHWLSSDYLLCADENNGIVIFDVSDTSLPDLVANLQFPNAVAIDYEGSNHNLYVADKSDTLFVVDVSDPTNPSRIGHWAAPDQVLDVAVYNQDYVICACKASGIYALDISTPSSPTEAGSYNTPGSAQGLAIAGHLCYVADGSRGMRIIDITDPTNMFERGSLDPIGIAVSVSTYGTRAYLCNGGLGTTIIDITDPSSPSELGTIDSPGTAGWVKAVSTTHVFIGDGESGIRVYDVTNPSSPTEEGYLNSHGTANGMAFEGDNFIYLADGSDGIYLVHSDLIGIREGMENSLVRINIPNLIRDRIVINGAVPFKTKLSVEIDDVLGRKVDDFEVEVVGNFVVNRPITFSSGIYFIKVDGLGKTVRSKTVVVR